VYVHGKKLDLFKVFQEWGRGRERRMMEGKNLTTNIAKTCVNVTECPQYNKIK
jgi:hypothetical protein